MLVNHKNQIVQVSDKLNSVSHPRVFANLHEKLEPTPKYLGDLFKLENRVRITTKR